jgi:uncharacterized Rmd1/YagE family protein
MVMVVMRPLNQFSVTFLTWWIVCVLFSFVIELAPDIFRIFRSFLRL